MNFIYDYRLLIFLFHVIFVGPLLVHIGTKQKKGEPLSKNIISIIMNLGYLVILYHSYLLYQRYNILK